MHIPDGFLDVKTWTSSAAVASGVIAYSLRGVRKGLGDRQVPMVGVLAAFVFAAQMVNFPILGGTSGHLIGSTFLAVAIGPWAAVLVMTVVLLIQCLVFGDGGITALGANVLNMAVIAVFVGYYVYIVLTRAGRRVYGRENNRIRIFAAFAASWVSVLAAALACALEIAASGMIAPGIAISAMLFWHTFIGLGEGAITAAILAYLLEAKSEVLASMTNSDGVHTDTTGRMQIQT